MVVENDAQCHAGCERAMTGANDCPPNVGTGKNAAGIVPGSPPLEEAAVGFVGRPRFFGTVTSVHMRQVIDDTRLNG